MVQIHVIRHAQASFGAADYDVLSALGHRQALALGRALAVQGVRPDRLVIGAQRRHRETMQGIVAGLGLETAEFEQHPGLNEFDFKGLLDARQRGRPPVAGLHSDRGTHFRTLRDTVLEWQRDEIADPPETWAAFAARVEAARQVLGASGEVVLAVSSGGAIGQMVAAALNAPAAEQIKLQLQMKNCAVTRFVATPRQFYLHGFNETPHVTAATAELLTYS